MPVRQPDAVINVDINGEALAAYLYKSKKRKRVSIVIKPDNTLEIGVPVRFKMDSVTHFVELKKPWIAQCMKRNADNKHQLVLSTCGKLSRLFLGSYVNVVCIERKDVCLARAGAIGGLSCSPCDLETRFYSVRFRGGALYIFCWREVNEERVLHHWLLQQCQRVFEERLAICLESFRRVVPCQKPVLRIVKMRSRWGSMSFQGVMTLNFYLIHLPLEVIDYIVFHELCHIVHQDHGKGFYELQSRFVPNWHFLRGRMHGFYLKR